MGLRPLTVAAWVVLATSAGRAADVPSPTAPDAYRKHVVPVLAKHCYSCHGDKKQIAGVNLAKFADDTAVAANRKVWAKVLEQLEARAMPPEEKSQPTEQERALVAAWVQARLASADCVKGPRNPGRVTMRRLNRTEYNNTIRDLLALDFQPAADFPSDDVGYGFDNIGDVLSMPPLLMEKYLAAAEKILDKAFAPDDRNKRVVKRWKPNELRGQAAFVPKKGRRVMYTAGSVAPIDHDLPWPGEYVLRLKVHGGPAGGQNPKLSLKVGGEKPHVVEVTAADEAKPQTIEVRFTTRDPKLHWAAEFVNAARPIGDYRRGREPYQPKPGDRTVWLHYAELDGPLGEKPLPPTEAHRRLVPVVPPPEGERAAAEASVRAFARRAFRRPVAPDEVAGLMKLYDLADAQGADFEEALRLPLSAVLVSPYFLFRVEADPPDAKPGTVRPLPDLELASRLSYFLWSSTPDEELLSAAERGQLGKPAGLERQVRRMLADPKSSALVENFAGQWLQLRTLRTLTPDRRTYWQYSPELRDAMVRETELFFAEIVRKDRSVLDFLDADFTYVNDRLAKHYGLKGVSGDGFVRVALPAGGPRGGVLTQASVLTVTSNPTRTSPVKRGKWVLENLLGAPPPPPPPDVPELEEKGAELTGSLRQRMEQHRAKAMCASCHARMDPLGFGLENFDGVGMWRDRDGKHPIDASGTLPNGQSFDGPAGLKKVLLGRADEFRRCLVEKLMTYSLGRGLEYYDRCALDGVVQALKAKHDKFSELVLLVVTSDPFRQRRAGQE